jgi:hypothetical protein
MAVVAPVDLSSISEVDDQGPVEPDRTMIIQIWPLT